MNTKKSVIFAVAVLLACTFAATLPFVSDDAEGADLSSVDLNAVEGKPFEYTVTLNISTATFKVINTPGNPIVSLKSDGADVSGDVVWCEDAGSDNFSFVIEAKYQGMTVTQTVNVKITPASTVVIPELNGAIAGKVYEFIVRAGSGYMYSATGLPADLHMEDNGLIYGKPTTVGTYKVTILAVNTTTGDVVKEVRDLVVSDGEFDIVVDEESTTIGNGWNHSSLEDGHIFITPDASGLKFKINGPTGATYSVQMPEALGTSIEGTTEFVLNVDQSAATIGAETDTAGASGEYVIQVKSDATGVIENVIVYLIPSLDFTSAPVAGITISYP